MNRGQIQLSVATVMAGVSFVAAPLVAYYSSQMATAQAIAEVNTKTEVVETRVDHVDTQLDRLENKVDALLIQNGVNPKNVK